MLYVANPVEVTAFEITGVFGYTEDIAKEGLSLKFWDREAQHIKHATPEMCARYTPKVGDYYVIQADGYAYINPKEVFERKYRQVTQ